MENMEKETNAAELKICQIAANENIVKTIEQHIFIRKKCMGESEISKHGWANEAILTKLEKEKDLQSCILKSKSFSFLIARDLERKIDSRVELIKQLSGSCSRTKWILDAFLEKIEEERDTIRMQKELTTTSLKN